MYTKPPIILPRTGTSQHVQGLVAAVATAGAAHAGTAHAETGDSGGDRFFPAHDIPVALGGGVAGAVLAFSVAGVVMRRKFQIITGRLGQHDGLAGDLRDLKSRFTTVEVQNSSLRDEVRRGSDQVEGLSRELKTTQGDVTGISCDIVAVHGDLERMRTADTPTPAEHTAAFLIERLESVDPNEVQTALTALLNEDGPYSKVFALLSNRIGQSKIAGDLGTRAREVLLALATVPEKKLGKPHHANDYLRIRRASATVLGSIVEDAVEFGTYSNLLKNSQDDPRQYQYYYAVGRMLRLRSQVLPTSVNDVMPIQESEYLSSAIDGLYNRINDPEVRGFLKQAKVRVIFAMGSALDLGTRTEIFRLAKMTDHPLVKAFEDHRANPEAKDKEIVFHYYAHHQLDWTFNVNGYSQDEIVSANQLLPEDERGNFQNDYVEQVEKSLLQSYGSWEQTLLRRFEIGLKACAVLQEMGADGFALRIAKRLDPGDSVGSMGLEKNNRFACGLLAMNHPESSWNLEDIRGLVELLSRENSGYRFILQFLPRGLVAKVLVAMQPYVNKRDEQGLMVFLQYQSDGVQKLLDQA